MTGASVIFLFNFFKHLGSGCGPVKFLFLQAICNWGHDSAEPLYESSVEGCAPMKASYISNISGLRPFCNCLNFLRICRNSLRRYNKSQKYNSISYEHISLSLRIISFLKMQQTWLRWSIWCSSRLAVNQDVIKVHDQEFTHEGS